VGVGDCFCDVGFGVLLLLNVIWVFRRGGGETGGGGVGYDYS